MNRAARRRRLVGALVALIGTVAACGSPGVGGGVGETGFVSGTGTVTRIPAAERGEPVALRGPKVGGGELDLGAFRGRVVLINIWGSWCAPCRKEAPDLEAAWQQLRNQPVQFLGINTRDDAAGAAEAFERRFAVTYPSFRDPDGSLQLAFRRSLPPRAIPSTLVLDREGRVAARVIGATTRSTFVGLVADLLAERPPGRG